MALWRSSLPGSKVRGYKPGRFSFNVKGGRCEACQGDGVLKVEMHFPSDVYVKCEDCAGRRFNEATLEATSAPTAARAAAASWGRGRRRRWRA